MSDYFHESMVAKMISSDGYQQGYSIGFSCGYAQGKAEAIDEFVEKADSAIYEDFNKADVGEYTIADVALTIRRVAEQLKEKENE